MWHSGLGFFRKEKEACDVLRHYAVLKGRLMPYLWSQAVKTHRQGVPMMRPMIVSFTEDTACKCLDTQYMLGDNLCVVPVMNEEGIAEFYVPDCGTWTDIQSGETYEGGRYYTRKCDYFQMPILARPGSMIVYGKFDGDTQKSVLYDYAEGAEVVIYGLEKGQKTETVIYDTDALKVMKIRAVRENNTIKITVPKTEKNMTIRTKDACEILRIEE